MTKELEYCMTRENIGDFPDPAAVPLREGNTGQSLAGESAIPHVV